MPGRGGDRFRVWVDVEWGEIFTRVFTIQSRVPGITRFVTGGVGLLDRLRRRDVVNEGVPVWTFEREVAIAQVATDRGETALDETLHGFEG